MRFPPPTSPTPSAWDRRRRGHTHVDMHTGKEVCVHGAMHTCDVMLSESLNSMTHRLVQSVSACYSVWTIIPMLRPRWSFLKVVCFVCVCTCQNKDCTQSKVKPQTAIHKSQTDGWSANLSGDGWRAQIGVCVNAFFFFLQKTGTKVVTDQEYFTFSRLAPTPPPLHLFLSPSLNCLTSIPPTRLLMTPSRMS